MSNLQITQIQLSDSVFSQQSSDENDLKTGQEASNVLSDDSNVDTAASLNLVNTVQQNPQLLQQQQQQQHQQHTQRTGGGGGGGGGVGINSSTKLKNSSATGKPMTGDRGNRGRQSSLQQQSAKTRELKSTSMSSTKELPDSAR